MTTKWCLVKSSDGDRGALGKKKIYEVIVDDNNTITFIWGMAEKPNRQTKKLLCGGQQVALWKAREKVSEKLDKGYELAYSA
jgi:hypothetical protein